MAKIHLIFFLFTILATGCTSQLMTKPIYDRIAIGTPIDQVEMQAGSPREIRKTEKGVYHYRYIERIETGPGTIAQNCYILTIEDGIVIDKRMETDRSSISLRI